MGKKFLSREIARENGVQANAEQPVVYIVVPTYNEAENLPPLLVELFSLPIPGLNVVIVDDNSPDGTGEVAEQLRNACARRVHVIHRPEKQGLGSAYRQGFRYALERGADYVVQMDADFSHSPSYLPEFLQQAQRSDVVVGSRYVQDGRLDPRWHWWRLGLSWWANSVYVRLILGIGVRDATAGFKVWKRQALAAVLAYPVSSSGYIFQVEMAYLAEKLGFSAVELPIYFQDRHIGRSKMTMSIKLEAVWRTWYLRWQYRGVRPVKRQPSIRRMPRRESGQTSPDTQPRQSTAG